MTLLMESLRDMKVFKDVCESVTDGNVPVLVSGCQDSQKCHFAYGLGQTYAQRVFITYNETKAKEIYEDYKFFDQNVYYYPAKDVLFYNADIRGNAIISQRMKVLEALLENKPCTIITTIDGGMDFVLDLSILKKSQLKIQTGKELDLEKCINMLVSLGYERQAQVDSPGDFSVRGGIMDIFPLTKENPVRIELWGDEIDTIREFDVESQRSIETLDEVSVMPATEVVLSKDRLARGLKKMRLDKEKCVKKLREEGKNEVASRMESAYEEVKDALSYRISATGIESYISYFYENTGSFFEYFDNESTLFVMDEPVRCFERMEAVELEFRDSMTNRLEQGYILPGQMNVVYGKEQIFSILARENLVLLSALEQPVRYLKIENEFALQVQSIVSYNNHFPLLVEDLKKYQQKNWKVVFLCASRTRALRMTKDLQENEIKAVYSQDMEKESIKGQVVVSYGNLHRGFAYPQSKVAVITENDVFSQKKAKKRNKKKKYDGKYIQNFNELSVGDYVVHENHGIGIYRGIEKIEVDKITKDYVKVEYAGGGNLYVLATGVDVLQKYASADAKKPKINKLNSLEWKKTKSRVKGAVKEIASELVELYALRSKKDGFAFEKDTVWQQEFEEMFPFEETDDQLMAISDTKRDMESKKIMDRLICGDVGFGKTEVAIRAAFKAVMESKQVAVLVPTTILAKQHYTTFVERMKDFPVTVDMLSRFRTPAQQKQCIENLKKGNVDIVIGTHRLLSKDIAFKDLGLLVIDEEQRFGVTHKEKIKQMKGNVDVLALSATPIPRTLHMSLVGIRDMSVLEEAPIDRLPIQTYVMEHNPEMIREAIHRELAREGQVYYVYNRVNGIDRVAAEIKELVPEANVAFAHGQMSERELEKIMLAFIEGEIQVLVATTIIETGLDISNVNTMIIDDADRLGLSQLYQLRGRVGRSSRTSYAFFMYKRDKMLKETAEKRLQAIREFTDLGSGFKVAMRDLEIRGAGNLLGAAQSGHMESVGYDLYCKMLNDAVGKLKGTIQETEEYETSVEIDVDAFIPATYIRNEMQKLNMYKKISTIGNKEEMMDLQDECIDRFGEIPAAAENLFQIALIKAIAHRVYVTQIKQLGGVLRIYMYPQARLKVEKISDFLKNYGDRLKFYPDAMPYFAYTIHPGKVEKSVVSAKGNSANKLLKELLELVTQMEVELKEEGKE